MTTPKTIFEMNQKFDILINDLEDKIKRLDDKMEIYFIRKGDANVRNQL